MTGKKGFPLWQKIALGALALASIATPGYFYREEVYSFAQATSSSVREYVKGFAGVGGGRQPQDGSHDNKNIDIPIIVETRKPMPVETQPVVTPGIITPPARTQSPVQTVAPVPIQAMIHERLLFEVPEIREFDERIANAAVRQIKSTIYERGLAADEQKAWKYIAPTVRLGLHGLSRTDYVRYDDGGNVVVQLNYSGLPKIDYDRYGIEEIGNVLLNVHVGEVNLVKGTSKPFSIDAALFNATPNEELKGLQPQEWITQMALRDYLNKPKNTQWLMINGSYADWNKRVIEKRDSGSLTVYGRAVSSAIGHHQGLENWKVWINSNRVYQQAVDELLKSGNDLPMFLYGYMTALNGTGVIPSYQFSGQTIPYFSSALASRFGMPSKIVAAVYPSSWTGEGTHDEPFFYTLDFPNDDPLLQGYFGFWLKKEVFKKDYDDKPWNKPTAWIMERMDKRVSLLLK